MGLYLDLKKSFQRMLVTFSVNHLSDFQQETFPDAALGQICYRSDLDKLYRYTQNETELGHEWVEIPYDSLFLDFDAHAQIQELPNNHIVGTKAYGVEVEEHFVYPSLLIAVSMFNDTNFVKHDIVIDKLFEMFLPTKKVQIYRQSDGAAFGEFICQDGLEVMPMAKADQRPIQFLTVNLATDRTVSL